MSDKDILDRSCAWAIATALEEKEEMRRILLALIAELRITQSHSNYMLYAQRCCDKAVASLTALKVKEDSAKGLS